MSDLITWLRAQLAEDEREWSPLAVGPRQIGNPVARRILAEVDAKRRILARHTLKPGERQRICAECGGRDWKPEGDVLQPFPWVMPWPCPTVRLIALPYAYRPGYRPEWRP